MKLNLTPVYILSATPTLEELTEINPRMGFHQWSISASIAIYSFDDCTDFANFLLKNQPRVQELRQKANENTEAFIEGVLKEWLSSVDAKRTWQQLITCMRNACVGMEKVDKIESKY